MAGKRPNENAIRDFLADQLDLIEPGLALVDREHFLKNAQGAAGFLDIFARDAKGRLVIIEVKRTDAAAREAIQELFKYAALLRQRYLIRDVEYRLLLLSVEWHELLVPYSEFVKAAPFDIKAARIVLNSEGWPTHVEPVEPVATARQRRFSRRHFLWGFQSDSKAAAAIPMIAAHMRKAGLNDFVLVQSHSNNPAISDRAFVYFAPQELTLAEYRDRLRSQLSKEELAEFEDGIADLTEEEDRVGEAADAVWLPGYDDLFERLDPETSEISHPEKARHWFAAGAQLDVVVNRFGRLDDPNLSDGTILSELIGEGGGSDFLLRLTASTTSAPQMTALREAIRNVFFFNPDWRGGSLDLLDYAEKTGSAVVSMAAFSNEDILRAIAGAAFGYPAYIPTFRLEIKREAGEVETFMGLAEWDGTKVDFDELIKTHFDGDAFSYFLACHFGENRGLNADLMSDLGLRYVVFRLVDGVPERIRVVGASIAASPRSVGGSIFRLIEDNKDEVHKIVAMFMEHDQGFSRSIEDWLNNDFNVAERQIETLIPGLERPPAERFWSGKLEQCDLCSHPFNMCQFMIDAHVSGVGANVCAQCYLEEGKGGGTVYASTKKGWLMLGHDVRR